MARIKVTPEVDQPTSEPIPEWKRLSVERSLQTARQRAQIRSDQFVAATMQLMEERGSTDFTVQDVVDRSKMSIKTFYKFFASKDDLLVAVHETVLADEVIPRLKRHVEAKTDPIERIHSYITGMYELTEHPGPVSRALTTYRNHLAEARPDDLTRAFQPQINLIQELIRNAQDAGRMDRALTADRAAHVMHQTVIAAVHNRILEGDSASRISQEELWTFCSHGLGVRDALTPTPTRRRSTSRGQRGDRVRST
jgi:AcrR family transcriptional regulator